MHMLIRRSPHKFDVFHKHVYIILYDCIAVRSTEWLVIVHFKHAVVTFDLQYTEYTLVLQHLVIRDNDRYKNGELLEKHWET